MLVIHLPWALLTAVAFPFALSVRTWHPPVTVRLM